MAEFRLGRIRFVWKDAWVTATTYYVDDVVRYGGKTYICVVGHTSAADFYTDLDISPSKWNLMTDGQSWKGDWATSTFYAIGDIVKYGGNLYIANDSHTSQSLSANGLEADIANWDAYAEGFDWKNNWATTTRYKANDIVRYGGQTYVCNTGHTSASTDSDGLEVDQGKWDYFNKGFEFKGAYSSAGVRYKINDVVKQGSNLFLCTTAYTSATNFTAEQANWQLWVQGVEFEDQWNGGGTAYQVGDIVRYGGNQYISKTNHTASASSPPSTNTTDWYLFAENFNWANDWAINTSYKIGDVTRVNGNTYVALQDSPSISTTATATAATGNLVTVGDTTGMVADMAIQFSGTSIDGINNGATYYIANVASGTTITIKETLAGSAKTLTNDTGSMTVNASFHPINTTYWNRLNSGISWQGDWTDDNEYEVGDAVRYNANAYICVTKHRAESDDGSSIGVEGGGAVNSRPDQDTSGTYWNLLNIGSDTAVLTTQGDLVYFAGAGPARLPVGQEGQILRVSTDLEPEWATLGVTENAYYVAPHGTDGPAPINGRTVDKPWKTIRYACEQIEKGTKFPNAARLLELNRAFIAREVVEWIDYQVTNTIAPFDGAFVYEDFRCARDVGLVIDALIHDLTHGGNVKIRGAAQAVVGALVESELAGTGSYSKLVEEKEESAAAYGYFLTLVENILNQQAPSTNYQTTNGDNSTAVVSQYTETGITAEAGALTNLTTNLAIYTNAIADGDNSRIPARYVEPVVIIIKTGQYREVLPIIVPEHVCLLGDEVRSVNAGPAGSLVHKSDAKYSIETVNHLVSVIGDIVKGTSVTPTSGNVTAQEQDYPFADTPEETRVEQLARIIANQEDFKINTNVLRTLTDPTNYNTSYLVGYGDARKLIKENKQFFQEEVIAYITENYPNVKYSKTKCRRDVGYIVDAIVYDLTYGGNYQSLNAGLAYYEGATLLVDSTEKAATVAAYGQLKTAMAAVAEQSSYTALQSTVAPYADTAGSAAAKTLIETNIQIIADIVNGGTASAPNITVTAIATNEATATSHGLTVGDSFTPRTTANGFVAGTKYWVLTVPGANTFTVSQTFGGSTHTLTNGSGLSIVGDVIDYPATSGVDPGIIQAARDLDAGQETLVTALTSYISTNYPSLTYDSAKCQRDTRLITEAVMFDFMFNSNFATRVASHAYLRGNASEVYTLSQKAATRAAYADLAATIAGDTATYLNSEALAASRTATLFTTLDDIIYMGSFEGNNCANGTRNVEAAVYQLEVNRAFLKAEATAYIVDAYSDTVTATAISTNQITISDTSWLQRGTSVRFASAIGGLSANTTYYVIKIVDSTDFIVSTTRTGSAVTLSNASGSVAVTLFYNTTACLRDIDAYIDALKYDIKYPGNYKSLMASRYYYNAVLGSLEEDMYYVRNATGVRNMTLDGLSGDLLAPNTYGTSRVSAGAYVSLDPGWGPDDYRTWVTTRSCYVQNVTTFGTAAIGQKIDGALHNGGNDSIVSNDFTQVISDGIGAWVTNNGRAELVSVFTYYSHIGYLSENGGRIRGTNGNNSYGDFGSVAEGFDATETVGTAAVDNHNFKATVGEVLTNGSNLLAYAFDNAGNDYTEATWTISGAGTGAIADQDEFRDGAVFQVRLLELALAGSPGEFGGANYLTNQNTAQGGTTTSITIAAVDSELSTAYVGMKVYLTGGTGAGQYGTVATYNAGTKLATVTRETDGGAGWEHIVPGTTIVAPDASTTYVLEPRISFTAPTTSTTVSTMSASTTWTSAVYGNTNATYTGQTGTYGGTGSGATWDVVRNGTKYIVSSATAGTGYSRQETITIAGTSLGGTTTANDLTIKVTSINASTGAIEAFEATGYGSGGVYVAVASGGTAASSSADGETWTARTLPSSGTWSVVEHGEFDDGSSNLKVSRFVALRSGSTAAAYSADGVTWTASTLPASAAWTDIVFGEGRFVAIASDSTTVAISQDGEVWDITGTLNSTGWTAITHGNGTFVAVKSGSQDVATSPDGVTWTDTGTALPAASAWNSIAYGNNIYVAIATDSNDAAMSKNGTTWVASTVGSADGSSAANLEKIKYGQGLFVATSYVTGTADYNWIATSQDGLYWEWKGFDGLDNGIAGYNALAFGNPNRVGYWTLINYDSGNNVARVRTGAKAKGRAYVSQTKIFAVRLTEPGSGYDTAPTMTITDPNNTNEAPFTIRIGNGALGNPTFTNRGANYTASTAEILTGDGYADYFQTGSYVAVKHISTRPVAGSNVVFDSLPGRTFKLVNIITFLGSLDGSYTAFYQISPSLQIVESPPHEDSIETRIRYSQVRLTGHDFLDIGTGSFIETNYPGTPTQVPIPANETVDNNGGRVFYTSTDQDGNFRVGSLFSIEQSTGIATLNADAFNIAGLQELSLGEVSLGGGSASISEFSTDPFFTANSDSIVPTQRAIKAYISSQIGGGGASLNVNSVTAGSVFINTNQITTIGGTLINMRGKFKFSGQVDGYPVAWNYFLN